MFVTIKNTDIEHYFNFPKFHLIFAGYWPIADKEAKWAKSYQNLGRFFIFPYSSIVSFSIFVNLFFNLDSIEAATDAFYILASNLSFMLKFSSFTFKLDHFKDLLLSVDNPLFLTFNRKHDELVNKWKIFANTYSKYFYYSIYVCVTLFLIFPFLEPKKKILPLGGYIPFDIQNSVRNYVIAYCFQVVGLIFTVCLNISVDLLPSIFMNIGCGQVEILKDNLKYAIINAEERVRFKRNRVSNFDEIIEMRQKNYEIYEPLTEDVEKELHKILKHCVQHHDAINRLFRNIEQVFNPGMLIIFIFDGIAICVTFLQLLMVPIKSFKYLTVIQYLIAITVQISLYCWNGHHVIVQSSTIGDSCYEMEWFRCSTKMKKEIRIIIERCKRPVKLSAGGIFELSVTSLTHILRTSYQYFNVLRTVYSK